MVKISPFRALRPKKEYVVDFSTNAYETSAELPKDVNKFSYKQIVQPEAYLQKEIPSDEACAYSIRKLREFVDGAILIEDPVPSIYIYEQVKDGHVFHGFIAGASVDDYDKGNIKRHELTRTQKEDQITNYFLKIGINGSPVLLTYPSIDGLDLLLVEAKDRLAPLYDFTDEIGVHHRLWILGKGQIDEVQKHFESVDALYIADGHHRCAAAARAAREMQTTSTVSVMAFLIADNNISIHSYNRVIEDFGGLSQSGFLEALEKDFAIEKMDQGHYNPEKEKSFGLYIQRKWYKLMLREDIPPAPTHKEDLDVCILENHVLVPLLNITDSRNDPRISFIDGAAGVEALENKVDSGEAVAAFALHPATIEDIFVISDATETMPPKSTWVEPKLRSGLLLHEL